MNAKASAKGHHKKSVEVGKSQLWRASLIIPVGIILVALLLSSSGFDLLECVKWVGGVVTSGTSHIMSMFHLRMSVAACPPNIFTKTKSKPNSSSDWAIEFEKVERKLREIRINMASQQNLLREQEAEAKRMGVIVDEMLEQVVNMPLAVTNDDKVLTYKTICQEMNYNKDPRDCFYNLAALFYSFAPYLAESSPLLQNIKTDPVDVRIKFNNTLRGFVLPLLVVELEEHVKRFHSGNSSVSSLTVDPKEVHALWIREMNKYQVDYSNLIPIPPNLSLESEGGFILKATVASAPTLMNNGIESSRRRCHFRSWPALKLNTPNIILQPGKLIPGECWMIEGTMGDVFIKLPYLSHIRGFTLEHRNKTITQSGQVCSAPKYFQVLGLTSMAEHDINRGHNFGVYTYKDKKEKESARYFPILNYVSKPYYSIVLLRILSNQAYEKHTCVYRFHVHGHVSINQG